MNMTQRFHRLPGFIRSREDLAVRISPPEIIRLTCRLQSLEVRTTLANTRQEWRLLINATRCNDLTSIAPDIPAFIIEECATSEDEFAFMHQHFTRLMAHKTPLLVESEAFKLTDTTLTLVCPTYCAFSKDPSDCDTSLMLSGGLLSSAATESSAQSGASWPKDVVLSPAFTFQNFATCEANQLAVAAASFVAANPGEPSYNPIVIQGGRGTGKTHLLHAIGNTFLAEHKEASVIYLTAEQFVSDLVTALHSKRLAEYQTHLCSADMLLVDDLQTLARNAEAQSKLTDIIQSLASSGRQIVLTSDRFLPRLDQLDNHFKRQAKQWLAGQLGMPDLEARVAVLQRLAEESHITLPDKVATLIAERADADMHQLLHVMRMVIAQARFLKQSISIKMVNQAMKE